jgi:hypothetical protein
MQVNSLILTILYFRDWSIMINKFNPISNIGGRIEELSTISHPSGSDLL